MSETDVGGCYVDEVGKVHIVYQRGRTWWLLPRNDNCIPLNVSDTTLSYGALQGTLKDDTLRWRDTEQKVELLGDEDESKETREKVWRRIDMSCQQASFFAPPRVPVTYLLVLFLIVGVKKVASFGYLFLCRLYTYVPSL